MSRTADPSAGQRKTVYSIVLLIIALCLITHFLVEDGSLQRAVDTTSQSHSTAGLAFDEMEHQDDLAMTTNLPDSILHNDQPAIPAWSIRLKQQRAFPIRIPPKIA